MSVEDDVPEVPVDETDQATEEEVSAPEGTSAEEPVEESFTDLDLSETPEGGYTPEWIQERYKQMQADYTRKRQAESATAKERAEELEFLESLRSDPETQREVFDFLQENLQDDDDDEFEDDDSNEDPLAAQVRDLSEREERREADALARNVVSHIESLAKDANLDLDENDLSDIFAGATKSNAVNNANTLAAFEQWTSRQKAMQGKWLKSYLASKQSPRQVPPGQSGTESPDLNDQDTRIKRMAAILEGNS